MTAEPTAGPYVARVPFTRSAPAQNSNHRRAFLRGDIDIGFWNVQTLFGSIHSDADRIRRSWSTVGQLCNSCTILVLVEAHGSMDDLSSLERAFPSRWASGSFCDNRSAGGVVVMVSHGFASREACRVTPIEKGRAIRLFVDSG